jgi:hypothetical protein
VNTLEEALILRLSPQPHDLRGPFLLTGPLSSEGPWKFSVLDTPSARLETADGDPEVDPEVAVRLLLP